MQLRQADIVTTLSGTLVDVVGIKAKIGEGCAPNMIVVATK
jgi:hypothetical protein